MADRDGDGRGGEALRESNRSSGVEGKLSAYPSLGLGCRRCCRRCCRRRRCRCRRPRIGARSSRSACVGVVIVGYLCALVRAVTRPKVADARRSRPRRRGAARRGGRRHITITYPRRYSLPPLRSRLRARRTRTCSRASCVCRRVCVRVRASVSAASPARVLARERAAEERGTSANGSSQDYSKPRKYEHCCPITSCRVH